MKILDKIRPFKEDRRTTPAPRPLVIVSTSFQNPRIKQTSLDTTGEVASLEGIFAIDINNTGFLPTRGTRITNANITLKKGESSVNIGKVTDPVSLPSIPPGETKTVKLSFDRESVVINQLVDDICDQKVVTAEVNISIAELLLAATYNDTVELQVDNSSCTTLSLNIQGRDRVNVDQRYRWNVISEGGQDIPDVTWDMGDGTTKSGTTVEHEYTSEGEYEVTAEVESGISAETNVNVQALPLGITGSADIVVNKEYTWTATGPRADNADELTWILGDGTPPQNGQSVTHKYTSSGLYNIEVSTDAGNSTSLELNAEFPDVDITINGKSNVIFGKSNTWSVSGSKIPQVEEFNWRMGDAAPKSGESVTHTYTAQDAGGEATSYEITVDAVIQSQTVASDSFTVNAGFSDIQISFTQDRVQNQYGEPEKYDAVGDKVGDATNIRWSMGDGTVYESKDGDISGDLLQVTHTYETSGEYPITVSAFIDGNRITQATQTADIILGNL